MRTTHVTLALAAAALLAACATTVPKELSNAREAYRAAAAGDATRVAPAELHVAHEALAKAEKSFADDPKGYRTRDLAYVAQRKSELAAATASITLEQKSQNQSSKEFSAAQGQIIADGKQDADFARQALAASQRSGELTAAQLATEQQARIDAEKRAADALARLAAVKDEPRGMVITLSGSVLFASNQTVLLPDARTKLDQVAEVLLTTRERNLIIEGHTDSQGSDSHNMTLSQGRADAVRNDIIQRGYGADLVQARGMGEASPVADNGSAEGRANNRRVVIVIERDSKVSTR